MLLHVGEEANLPAVEIPRRGGWRWERTAIFEAEAKHCERDQDFGADGFLGSL